MQTRPPIGRPEWHPALITPAGVGGQYDTARANVQGVARAPDGPGLRGTQSIETPAALIGAAFLAISLSTYCRRNSVERRSGATMMAPAPSAWLCTAGVSMAST